MYVKYRFFALNVYKFLKVYYYHKLLYCVRVIIKPIKEGYSTAYIQICMNCLKTLNLRLYYAHLKMACIDIRTYSFKHRVIYIYVRFTAFELRFRYQSWNGKNLQGFGNVALVFGKMRYFECYAFVTEIKCV